LALIKELSWSAAVKITVGQASHWPRITGIVDFTMCGHFWMFAYSNVSYRKRNSHCQGPVYHNGRTRL